MPSPPRARPAAASPSRHSTTGTPSAQVPTRAARRAAAARAGRRARRARPAPARRTAPARSRRRRGRSRARAGRASARTARSSSSGVSAITSACGGSVRARQDVDVLPRVAEEDLGVEQRVDDPVELDDPAARDVSQWRTPPKATRPTRSLLAEVARRRASRPRATARSSVPVAPRAGLGEACRGRGRRRCSAPGASRSPTSSPRRAVARQLIAAHAVAGHERPQVGELDPLALRARDAGCR